MLLFHLPVGSMQLGRVRKAAKMKNQDLTVARCLSRCHLHRVTLPPIVSRMPRVAVAQSFASCILSEGDTSLASSVNPPDLCRECSDGIVHHAKLPGGNISHLYPRVYTVHFLAIVQA